MDKLDKSTETSYYVYDGRDWHSHEYKADVNQPVKNIASSPKRATQRETGNKSGAASGHSKGGNAQKAGSIGGKVGSMAAGDTGAAAKAVGINASASGIGRMDQLAEVLKEQSKLEFCSVEKLVEKYMPDEWNELAEPSKSLFVQTSNMFEKIQQDAKERYEKSTSVIMNRTIQTGVDKIHKAAYSTVESRIQRQVRDLSEQMGKTLGNGNLSYKSIENLAVKESREIAFVARMLTLFTILTILTGGAPLAVAGLSGVTIGSFSGGLSSVANVALSGVQSGTEKLAAEFVMSGMFESYTVTAGLVTESIYDAMKQAQEQK